MARTPSWPKGRPRMKIAKQVGYTRPTNAQGVGNIILVKPAIEELMFRGPIALVALLGDW